jgi:hypothetical protein
MTEEERDKVFAEGFYSGISYSAKRLELMHTETSLHNYFLVAANILRNVIDENCTDYS